MATKEVIWGLLCCCHCHSQPLVFIQNTGLSSSFSKKKHPTAAAFVEHIEKKSQFSLKLPARTPVPNGIIYPCVVIIASWAKTKPMGFGAWVSSKWAKAGSIPQRKPLWCLKGSWSHHWNLEGPTVPWTRSMEQQERRKTSMTPLRVLYLPMWIWTGGRLLDFLKGKGLYRWIET